MPSFAAALFSCALVIASGYFAGRVKVIRVEGEGPRALGTFIGRFSLPALLFKELATLSFASIDVHLLVAIATGKAAGSNDFALGLPVMTALYKDTRPEMVSMLYLLSPVSLLLLNPVGFLLMGAASPGPDAPPDDDDDVAPTIEDSPRPSAASAPRGPARPGRVLLRVVRTPSSPARLVGKVTKLHPSALLLPGVLSGIKCVVLPIAIYLAVGLTGGDGDLRGFGFVYGAIPTAPSVLVYAHEYLGHDPETAATTAVSLVVCTLASTPVVLFAGLVIQAGHVGVVLDEYARTTDAYLCVPSCVLAAWVAASFYATWRADWARRKDETGGGYGASVAYLGVTLALCLLGLRKARETQDRYYARSRQDLAALDAETKAPDDLPGGADTLDGTADLAAFGASLGRRRQQLSLSFSSLPGDDPRDATDTRLAAAVGHRLLLFILLHVIHAFLNICACAARLGPRDGFGKAGSTVKVLSLIADTFSSSMGIFIFLVFGLARHQVLWRATSDQLKRLCCVPRRQRGGASRRGWSALVVSAGSDGRRRHAGPPHVLRRQRDLLRTAAGASLAPAAARAETRSPRPVSWRIVDGDPPVMQPYVSRAVESCLKQIASFDVVLLGAKRGDAGDYALAADLVRELRKKSGRPVALGLDAAPLGAGPALAGGDWLKTADAWPAVAAAGARRTSSRSRPSSASVVGDVVPLGVAAEAMGRVQRDGGIAALSEAERNAYVDASAFVRCEAQSRPASGVIERRYRAAGYANISGAPAYADFFASTILYDEAAASLAARYKRSAPGGLLVCVVGEDHVKFGYGVQGRLDRLEVDPDKAGSPTFRSTSVLLNPTAESSGSLSASLRLALAADQKVTRPLANYVWFSESPKPALISHMMNPIDGNFKIDLGLSLPSL
ncbi:hypothetical protein JL720_3442 [Aureococcus anophagefferens]|nr:hypothetical protein JL720_3442 [Aureococcus anophagefferens]